MLPLQCIDIVCPVETLYQQHERIRIRQTKCAKNQDWADIRCKSIALTQLDVTQSAIRMSQNARANGDVQKRKMSWRSANYPQNSIQSIRYFVDKMIHFATNVMAWYRMMSEYQGKSLNALRISLKSIAWPHNQHVMLSLCIGGRAAYIVGGIEPQKILMLLFLLF